MTILSGLFKVKQLFSDWTSIVKSIDDITSFDTSVDCIVLFYSKIIFELKFDHNW